VSYSVDTSALMDAWVRYYPPDVFRSVWDRLDALAKANRLVAIDEVYRELSKKEDDLYKWMSQRLHMCIAIDEAIQSRVQTIVNRYPTLTHTKSVMSGAADPFVIALALERQLTVITAEQSRPSKPRIPDACLDLGVECITLVQMFRQEGWRL
jgi:Domain of unknown function (DUF4411)